MSRMLKACAILSVCVLLSASAFAESQDQYQALLSDSHQALFASESSDWNPIATRTPELGDHSIALATLAGISSLALAGAVVAHKKARSNAR